MTGGSRAADAAARASVLRRVGKNQGRKPEWKKALVRLAEGQSIEFFEGM